MLNGHNGYQPPAQRLAAWLVGYVPANGPTVRWGQTPRVGIIVLLEKDVNVEEERQSGSSSGWVNPLHVQRTACSYEFSCMEIVWPSVGRPLCARFTT